MGSVNTKWINIWCSVKFDKKTFPTIFKMHVPIGFLEPPDFKITLDSLDTTITLNWYQEQK
jgi:hypothetical protein